MAWGGPPGTPPGGPPAVPAGGPHPRGRPPPIVSRGRGQSTPPGVRPRPTPAGAAPPAIVYTADGIAYRREYLASAPQQALVLRYTADKPGAYNGTLKLTDAHAARTTASGNLLTAGCKLANGLQYETAVQVVNTAGHITASPDGVLRIEHADALTILVTAGTNYLAQEH